MFIFTQLEASLDIRSNHKFCTVTHGGDRGDRRGAVAARVTKAERQPPDIKVTLRVGPSLSLIHI